MRERIFKSAALVSVISIIFALVGCMRLPSRIALKISETELLLKVGESKTLTANMDDVSWLSENDRVITVQDGTVTAVEVGKTTVLAVCGDAEAACTVTVVEDNGTDDPELIKKGYKLIWHDEFDGDALDMNNWSYQIGTRDNYGSGQGPDNWGNNEQQYYSENNVKVSDGKLSVAAIKEPEKVGGKWYTSGRITSRGKFSFTYGYIEAKIQAPRGDGMWPAFWMLPQPPTTENSHNEYGGWARNGEIDIMEIKGRLPEQYGAALHFGDNYPKNDSAGKTIALNGAVDEWHTYALEWSAEKITWLADGNEVFSVSSSRWWTAAVPSEQNHAAPFDKPFYVLLNLAVGGTYDGGIKPPDDFDRAVMNVDYVRVYQPNK